MKRRRIHSNIKLLEAAAVLPAEYRNSIHRSQLWRYRKLSDNDFFGAELASKSTEDVELSLERYPLLKSVVFSIIRILDCIQLLINKATQGRLAIKKLVVLTAHKWSTFINVILKDKKPECAESVSREFPSGRSTCIELPQLSEKSSTRVEACEPHTAKIDSG